MSNKTPEDREPEIAIEHGIPLIPSVEDRAERERREKEARDEKRRESEHQIQARQVAISEDQKTIMAKQRTDGVVLIRLNFGLLVVSILAGSAAWYQAIVSQAATEAAVRSADVAQETLNDSRIAAKESERRMDELADGMKKSVNAFIEQAQNSRRMNDTVREQAQRFFDENSRIFLDQRRAWVGFSAITAPNYPSLDGNVYVAEGKPMTFQMTFKNFGPTPAVRLRMGVSYKGYSRGIVPPALNIIPVGSETDVAPDSVFLTPNRDAKKDEYLFTKADIDKISAGDLILYVIATVRYYDIANRKHETRLCKYLLPDLNFFADCPTGNSID